MKKFGIKIFSLILLVSAVMFAFGAVACGGKNTNDNTDKKEPTKKEFSLDKEELNLIYGDSAVLIPRNYTESDGVIEWKSSDESVVSIDGGSVTACGIGSAVITAAVGDKNADCKVSVSFGSYEPTLEMERFSEELTLSKGSEYALSGKIRFNGKDYAADKLQVTFSDSGVADFSEGKIVPLKTGTTEVTVKGEWNGFETSLLSKKFSLTVISGKVSMTVYMIKNGVREASDNAEIYITSEWAGNTYPDSVGVEVEVTEDGVKKEAEITADSKDRNVIYSNGVISARGRGIGESQLTATYTDLEGTEYSQTITVTVLCPVAKYDGQVRWNGEKFDYTEYFGDKANILSVTQGDRKIDSEPKKIIGSFKFKGEDTEEIRILTNKGGYIFSDIYGYDASLTTENIVSALSLAGKKVEGYYILESDVGTAETPVDFTSQSGSSESSFFAGTFLGNGYTVYAKVARQGMFGGAGSGVVIRDTKFVFTFDKNSAEACGFFGDDNRQNKTSGRGALLENLYIITTNFGENRFAVALHRMLGLKLKDVLVDLGDTSAVADFDGRKNVAALFRTDYNLSPMFNGEATENKLENVRVITGKFMPIANGDGWSDSKSSYLNFAGNDEVKFGNVTRAGEEEVEYARITSAEFHDDWRRDIMILLNEFTKCFTMFYGTYRYDTAAELVAEGTTSVGSWQVA